MIEFTGETCVYSDEHFSIPFHSKMAYLGKVFKFEKHENYDGFIKSLGKNVCFYNRHQRDYWSNVRITKRYHRNLQFSIAGKSDTSLPIQGSCTKKKGLHVIILSGVPDDKAEILLRAKPSQKLIKNGDKYTLSVITAEYTRDVAFKSGVEFDEDIQGLLVNILIYLL